MDIANLSSKEKLLSQLYSVPGMGTLPVSGTLRYPLNRRATTRVQVDSFDLDQLLSGVTTVAIGGHTNPDGDCVGSCIGLYLYLLKNYPKIEVDVYLEEIPPSFHLLSRTEDIKHQVNLVEQSNASVCSKNINKGIISYEILTDENRIDEVKTDSRQVGKIRTDENRIDEIKTDSRQVDEIRTDKQYDLFICLDCGDLNRLGFSLPLFKKAKKTLCIDHHISNQGFADMNYIVSSAGSTSELVFHLLDMKRIPLSGANALYLGIIHDTGVFQYTSTSADTLRVAADLLAMGVDGHRIIDETYYSKSYIQNRVLGKVLVDSQLILENRGVISILSKQEREALQATIHDLDGIVSVLRTTKGVDVAIFVYEVEPHQYKVSLRSTGAIDVRLVAEVFGGGGHQRAAGVAMGGKVEEIQEKLVREILKQM